MSQQGHVTHTGGTSKRRGPVRCQSRPHSRGMEGLPATTATHKAPTTSTLQGPFLWAHILSVLIEQLIQQLSLLVSRGKTLTAAGGSIIVRQTMNQWWVWGRMPARRPHPLPAPSGTASWRTTHFLLIQVTHRETEPPPRGQSCYKNRVLDKMFLRRCFVSTQAMIYTLLSYMTRVRFFWAS